MKEFIDLIKKLWSNKKYRTIAVLLIYLVFFIFVFSLLNNSTSKPNIDNDNNVDKEESNIITNREFTIEIVGLENFIVDKDIIIYEGVNYSIDSNIVDLNKYNISYFTIDNMNNLIKNGILESVNYINNSKSYLVDIIYYDSTKEGNFKIIVYEDKIEIDLYDFYNYKVIMKYKRS